MAISGKTVADNITSPRLMKMECLYTFVHKSMHFFYTQTESKPTFLTEHMMIQQTFNSCGFFFFADRRNGTNVKIFIMWG